MWDSVGRELFPDVPDFAFRVKGQTLASIKEHWLKGDESLAARMKECLDAFEAKMNYPYMPGAEDFLRECRKDGLKTALVTSSDVRKMLFVYKEHPRFTELFDVLVLAEDVRHSKPAPDAYQLAAEKLGLLPTDCVVFEDSLNGLRAGRASGAFVVGLSTTLAAEEVQPLSDIVVPGFSHLKVCDLQRMVK